MNNTLALFGLEARARADDDFQRHVEFRASPEPFEPGEEFGLGLSHFFGRELVEEWTERRGNFCELLPVFFGGR